MTGWPNVPASGLRRPLDAVTLEACAQWHEDCADELGLAAEPLRDAPAGSPRRFLDSCKAREARFHQRCADQLRALLLPLCGGGHG